MRGGGESQGVRGGSSSVAMCLQAVRGRHVLLWWQKGGNRGDAESARPLINQNCRLTQGGGLNVKYHPNVATRWTRIATFPFLKTVLIFIHREVSDRNADIPILLRSALSHKAIPSSSSENHLAPKWNSHCVLHASATISCLLHILCWFVSCSYF